jgi:hypothetical protein
VQNRDEGQFSWLKARTIQYNCGIWKRLLSVWSPAPTDLAGGSGHPE